MGETSTESSREKHGMGLDERRRTRRKGACLCFRRSRTYYPASVREKDKQYWYAFWRHGLRHCLVRDHEDCWRDAGESFTFRIKAAPKKGGDQGFYDYARYMQDTLGFYYGPYNNFTDFAPVNEYWSTDMVARTADNQLMPAWARCYAPKPLRAVEYCEKLSPIIQEKFHFSTAYCDVHTSVTPWGRCDYDWRVQINSFSDFRYHTVVTKIIRRPIIATRDTKKSRY